MAPHLTALAVAAALAAPQSETPAIVIGKSIGAIRLGMSRAAVVAVYGKPHRELYTEPYYLRHGGRFRIEYHGGRVTWIETWSRFYRTAEGVGPGAPLAAAVRLPGFHRDLCSGGYWRIAGGAITIFGTEDGKRVSDVAIVDAAHYDC